MATLIVILRALRHAMILARIATVARAHQTQLARRYRQLVRPDAYGKPQRGRWEKELDYFIAEHASPALPRAAQRWLASNPALARARIQAIVKATLARENLADFGPETTPDAYELACATALRQAGWHAEATPPGADQGADVIAEQAGCRLVLQCKWVSRPVGNRAVQEAAAARAFYGASMAAVVSNQPYTRAAIQLAAGNGVQLLHHTDLPNLAPPQPAPLRHPSRKDGRAA